MLNQSTSTTQPLLTIAIPTYQRRKWLEKNLDLVIPQVNELPDGLVEIVVSDNASDDGSWNYLQTLASANPSLVLNRNEVNLGAEGNIYLLPSFATGKYLWLLGDDDFLEAGALEKIIEKLQSAPDYVVVNFATSDENLSRMGKPYWLQN